MNYRHIYHAGNFADVVKHAVVALVLDYLKQKDKPFFVLDTHAGGGLYDLGSPEAQKTGEFRDGIGRLVAEPSPPSELDPYLAAVRAANGGRLSPLRWYPGSPALIRHLLRPGDRLFAVELHPTDGALLRAEFARDPRVKVYLMDGYLALKSMLPPAERRGFVLVDPPFEEREEFDRLVTGLEDAHERWATGIYALWYPIKHPRVTERFLSAVEGTGIRRMLNAELLIREPRDPELLNGCGLVLVNPYWTLEDHLRSLLPFLVRVLSCAPGAAFRLRWLTPE